METWIVADGDALAGYYGQGFQGDALPQRQDLEIESRYNVRKALTRATRDTGKAVIHKIHHAADLLGRLDSRIVRRRCRSCDRLFATLDQSLP